MALDQKMAKAVVIGAAGLASLVVNPNFDARDFREPHRYIQKTQSHRSYRHSGMVYAVSAAAVYGAAVAGLYSVLYKKK